MERHIYIFKLFKNSLKFTKKGFCGLLQEKLARGLIPPVRIFRETSAKSDDRQFQEKEQSLATRRTDKLF